MINRMKPRPFKDYRSAKIKLTIIKEVIN